MLENPNPNHPSATSTTSTVKRYAHPGQRNRLISRRKSGDRYERTNSLYGSDGEKNHAASARNVPITDHAEAGSSNQNDNRHPGFVAIDGCSSSVAARLLNGRWAAAMHSLSDPSIDLSERPVMYSGAAASAWGHSRLPHQMDFLAELRRAMRNANNSSDA